MESENKIESMSTAEDQQINRTAVDRMKLCLQCEHFFKPTRQCKKCGCFMVYKVRSPNATCPVNKW